MTVLPARAAGVVGDDRSCILTDNAGTACYRGSELAPVPGLDKVKQVVSQARYTGSVWGCALRMDGTVWCWGSNHRGGLGMVPPDFSKPALVDLGRP